jgi:hypothetical protein
MTDIKKWFSWGRIISISTTAILGFAEPISLGSMQDFRSSASPVRALSLGVLSTVLTFNVDIYLDSVPSCFS